MLIILSSLLLVLTDIVFIRGLGLEANYPRPFWPQFFQVTIICLLLRSSFSQVVYIRWLRVLLTFSFLQWLCLSYYGTYLTPMMIFLFFKDFHEVFESSKGALSIIAKPVAWYCISLFLLNKIKDRDVNANAPLIPSKVWLNAVKGIVVFTLVYPIPRTYFTGHTFGKQAKVQESSFVNFFGTLSYFFGRIAPVKLKGLFFESARGNESPVQNREISEPQPQRHVVFILGESLGLRHLQLFGYAQPTTPRLKELFDKQKLFIKRGVSGGVSTDVSIPMLMHGANGEEAATTIAIQNNCLFKLAKQNGFKTAFISAQTQENLQHISNYFCNSYLDAYRAGDNSKTVNGESAILDEELIKEAQTLNWDVPQFAIFHQRGSHSPYEMRYPADKALFKINSSDPWDQQQKKHYDNSVFYSDQVIVELVQWIQTHSRLPVEIVFTSDHGEALGEDQQWGHVILYPVVAEVPVLYFPSLEKFKTTFENQPSWVSHRFVSEFITTLLGYKVNDFTKEKEFFVMGADLDGLGGHIKLQPQNNELIKIPE